MLNAVQPPTLDVYLLFRPFDLHAMFHTFVPPALDFHSMFFSFCIYRVCHFDKSPKMSTYLVAFIVGEFEAVEGKSKDGTLVRCYTPMGKTEQGKFALETSIRSIEYYTEFFGVEYPLPK